MGSCVEKMVHRTCFSIENVFLSFLFYRINTAKTSALPTFSKWKKKQISFDAIKQQSLTERNLAILEIYEERVQPYSVPLKFTSLMISPIIKSKRIEYVITPFSRSSYKRKLQICEQERRLKRVFFLDYVALTWLSMRRNTSCGPLITNRELWHRQRNGNDNVRN